MKSEEHTDTGNNKSKHAGEDVSHLDQEASTAISRRKKESGIR